MYLYDLLIISVSQPFLEESDFLPSLLLELTFLRHLKFKKAICWIKLREM